jgi:predicted phosphohydrolase
MRILVTADLHYDIARSREPARGAAHDICARGGDAVVLVGDTAGAQPGPLHEALELFAGFGGRKFIVAGNHCLWCRQGENSIQRYEKLLPAIAAEHGFEMLDQAPAVVGDVGFVGSVGWYDYSFRDESLGLPEAFYRVKMAPGAARYLGQHKDLVASHQGELTERHLAMGARWMDGVHVRMNMSDEQFLDMLNARLTEHLRQVSEQSRQVVAFIHHLPFHDLVPQNRPDRFAFAAAYMGAAKLGETLLACEKLTHVYCGHSHWPGRVRIGEVEVVNVGSTYVEKRIEELEIVPEAGSSGLGNGS